MENILSYSFTFSTDSTTASSGQYQNILYLSDENNSKHFVQLIQYHENSDNSIDLRHISIKVDRSYFLEIANVCISDRDRRRHFFSTLGKRRFGASNKHLDCYFTHTSYDEKSLHSTYLSHYEYLEFNPCHTITTKYATNKYRVYIQEEKDINIVFLDQLNISPRKKIHKIFCLDLTNDELELYNNLTTPNQRVNYLFNKIGKNYFKNLKQKHLKKTKHYSNNEALALSMLITSSKGMQRSSSIQDNAPYRKLQEKKDEIQKRTTTLMQTTHSLLKNPSKEIEEIFTLKLKNFILHLEGIEGLEDMLLQFEEIYGLAQTNTLSYLLLKNDHSLQDIILYLLEIFDMWSQLLYSENEDIKSFNSASIDLTDTLRHFIDVSYKF
ncbi:MAG: hypothetical protein Q9M34_11370, partial [Sulfurimonas sp.]|nr:hypothetical protein [Sulfurimonas sp.]